MEDHGWQRVGTASLGTASRRQWTAKRGLAGRGHSGTLHGVGEPKHSDGRVGTAQHSPDCPAQRRLCNQWLRQTTSRNCGGLAHQRSPVRGWGIATSRRESREQGKAKHDIAGATHSFAMSATAERRLHWRSFSARGQGSDTPSHDSLGRGNDTLGKGNALLETAKAAIDEAMSAQPRLGAAAWALRRSQAQQCWGMALQHSAQRRNSTESHGIALTGFGIGTGRRGRATALP